MKKIVLWVLGGFAIAGAAVCGLGYVAINALANADNPIPVANLTPNHRKEAEASMRLRFPASAEIRFYQRLNFGQDPAVLVKLYLPAGEIARLLSQPVFKGVVWEPVSKTNPLFDDQAGWPDWTPSKVAKGREAKFELPNTQHEYLQILVDDTSASEKEVYLMWFEV